MNTITRTWSTDMTFYALSDQCSIRKADAKDWSLYNSIYYNQAYNGFFKEYGFDVYDGNNAFWIFNYESKIGGVILTENRLYNLFFIPPFNDELKVVKLLKHLLVDFSDGSKNITVINVLPHQVDLFSQAGFWADINRSRMMQRPTEVLNTIWDDGFRIESPVMENGKFSIELEIAELFFESYKGGINAARRNHISKESFIFKRSSNIFTDSMLKASTLVFDNNTKQLVGSCLLFLEDKQRTYYPGVFNIGVLPNYRNKGLASNMLKRALTLLYGEYPILRIGVLQGTYAESLYYNLGFMPADVEVERLVLPTSEIKLLKSIQ
ncbi:GNAT family N-acetyltransferase [Paenibacillus oceani]|uniref:GNAT family N-acetyltransferase n=1 Tax=Paenibacillus oceani TaxID=2772510 RepID=A0A927GZS6_9BACL|nr:GNAT family N-acetyltransferase [Paenibacillus oceani]MBD2862397.1 GNAT family N-acetyltransferase [Paenibacillus oceani]